MSESLESLYKVTYDNLKNKFRYMKEEIKEIQELKDINDIEKVKELTDNISLTLKIIRKIKMLIKKFKRIEEEINDLSFYAYKPEEIDTDDEEIWEKEEQELKMIMHDMEINNMIHEEYIYDDKSEFDNGIIRILRPPLRSKSESEIDNEKIKKLTINPLILKEIDDEENGIKHNIHPLKIEDINYEENKKLHKKLYKKLKSEIIKNYNENI